MLKGSLQQLDTCIEKLRTELHSVEAKNERLAAIVVEQEQLLAEAKGYLTRFQSKRATLRAKYRLVTGQLLGHHTTLE